MTTKTIKEWVEHYYEDPTTGLNFYRPKYTEHLIKLECKCIMYQGDINKKYIAIINDSEIQGPVATADTIEECESKFHEMFMMCLYIGGLLRMDRKNIEKILHEYIIKFPQYLIDYKNGNTGLLGLFVGYIMKQRTNKGDPKYILEITKNFLNSV